MPDKSRKDEAQREFDKVSKAEDAKKAMSDYEAEAAAIRAKTERLRALRLARDAALESAPTSAKSSGPKATRVKKQSARKKTETNASLSEWLDAQEQSGRRR